MQPPALVFQGSMEIPMLSANQSVPPTQNVPLCWHVFRTNVQIHVQGFVEVMLHARLTIISPAVFVILVTRGILSELVVQEPLYHQELKQLIHVIQRLVDLMLFAKPETGLLPVSVFLNTLEIPTQPVDQSVLSTQIVPLTKHARGTSVQTLVQGHVVSMLSAM